MGKAAETRERLLAAARESFWTRGYSNVSLREIAREAGCDVALVSRYFGAKRGLFEATLQNALGWPELTAPGGPGPAAVAAGKFSDPGKAGHMQAALSMILTNADDAEVGGAVRAALGRAILAPLAERIGGPAPERRAALFLSVLIGAATGRQVLHLPGLSEASPDAYRAALERLLHAALAADSEA